MTDLERQILQSRLWAAVLDIDLQLYKGGVYRLRWGSPGVGLDVAVPCYQEARRTAELTPWPEELRKGADDLAERIAKYVVTLQARDVTSASGQHSGLMRSFEALRERVRAWPDSGANGAPGLDGAAGGG
ncbi:MAG TPA: hypothetical protein VFA45_01355 [Actinomycetes bacterium]|nr:hypothetical protein [Actinomycetes bacterium]